MINFIKRFWLICIILVIIGIVLLFYLLITRYYVVNNLHKTSLTSIIRIAVGSEPKSLDPNIISGKWEVNIVLNLFEGLTVRNKDGSIIPGVATKWGSSKDNTVYTFYLRKDAKWSDGVPVTAHDFEYSIKRLLNPKTKSKVASLLYVIVGAEEFNTSNGLEKDVKAYAIDDYTLRIELKFPVHYFPDLVAYTSYLPIPKHIVIIEGNKWTNINNIVSNGPYKIVNWKPKSYISAIKNDYYWDQANLNIQRIYFYTQENKTVLLKKYLAGKLDILPNVDTVNYKLMIENVKKDIKVFPYMSTLFYLININDAKFKNIKVREALNMAIDRDFLVQKVLSSPETPVTYNLIPQGIKSYEYIRPEWAAWSMSKRIAKAISLLQEAGYTKQKPLTFSIAYNNITDNKPIAYALSQMWNKIGIKTHIYNKDTIVHYADLALGKFEVARMSWVIDYIDPSSFINIFSQYSSNNYIKFNDAEYNKEFLMGRKAKSIKESMKHYKNAEQILLASNSIIPLYHCTTRTLVNPNIKGMEPNAVDIHLVRFMSLSN